MSYENILVDREGAVALVTLNRPQQLNALSYGLVKELALALESLDQDQEIRAMANKIAAKSLLAVRAAKEAVQKAWETPLEEGLQFERKSFYLLFASEDRREGMKAFIEKRKPVFTGK